MPCRRSRSTVQLANHDSLVLTDAQSPTFVTYNGISAFLLHIPFLTLKPI